MAADFPRKGPSPEQEPHYIEVIHIPATPIICQYRHECKQESHHAVLQSTPCQHSKASIPHKGMSESHKKAGVPGVACEESACNGALPAG